jgi:hypothetical protein
MLSSNQRSMEELSMSILDTILFDARDDGYKIWQHIDTKEFYITGEGCNPYMSYKTLDQVIESINYKKSYLEDSNA